LARLGEYTRAHFDREEAFMRNIRYPELCAHKTEHDLLMAEYTELVQSVRDDGARDMDPEALDALKRWLMGHVLDADRHLADFYLERFGLTSAGPQAE
jgi:hemerythrin-like metal-binding protein